MIPDHYVPKFWGLVAKAEGCWEWGGPRNKKGYGLFHVADNGQKGRIRAHRIAYSLTTGNDPGPMQVDHMCFNKGCVNPSHLRIVTNKQNLENRPGAQRNSTTGIRGVYKAPTGRFYARVKHEQHAHHAGTFDTAEEASEAARNLRLRLFTHNTVDQMQARTKSA